MHVHILGVCGTFMGGIARLARELGHRVTGCDVNVYPPMSTQLAAAGIELIEGYGADQVRLAPDVYVIGNVVSRGNALAEEVLDRGLPFTSGPQWLHEQALRGRTVIAVAGTHGKTTTSSMLAWILEDCGMAPGFLIGGVPINFGVSARLGGKGVFVIEADEYDTAFFDKRSKFVHYLPRIAVLNNLEYDHADIFPDLAAIETQFHHLVRTVPRGGRIIANGRDAALGRVLARGAWTPIVQFGVTAGWQATRGEAGVAIFDAGRCVGMLRQPPSGEHQLQNALAALAASVVAGADEGRALDALSRFGGVKRRMEIVGSVRGVTVYDDFAHHPTAIAATIASLRERVGPNRATGRVIAVVEPRSNTMKLGVMKASLASSLSDADLVFGYGAREGHDALGWDLGRALMPLGNRARSFEVLEALVTAIGESARAGDHVLVMSNGAFGGVHRKILDAIQAS